jgi:hypothetical protein
MLHSGWREIESLEDQTSKIVVAEGARQLNTIRLRLRESKARFDHVAHKSDQQRVQKLANV